MSIKDAVKGKLLEIQAAIAQAVEQAKVIGADDLERVLKGAVKGLQDLNDETDGMFDKGLDAIEQSKYTPAIVVSIAAVTAAVGGWIGWTLHGWFV